MVHLPRDKAAWAAVAGIPALLVLAYLVYAPGLSGSFLFDDYINLDALGRVGGINDWQALVDYLLSSHTGTGGRPIALASYLLDANNWPAAPRPFKYTNILFHLLTMVAVLWLTLQLAIALGYDQRRQYLIALLAAALWGLHPYLVSTVLYVVQRMAILSALFVTFGLGCYVRGRHLLGRGRVRPGYIWMTIGIGLFTPLAFLSKPNGGLLPLLAFVLDATLLRHLAVPQHGQRQWHAWHFVFVYLPITVIIAYFALNWQTRILQGYETRLFSLGERVLTEGRILMEYLAHLAIPRIQTSGLFHDNYPVSTGLFSPPTTAVALLAIVSAVAGAIFTRRRYPMVSAAILFFFAAHAVESTFVPLELYFEHRNYLPAVLPAIALAFGITRISEARILSSPSFIAGLIATALAASYATFTFARAQLWGNPERQAKVWVTENPGSVRARQRLAGMYMDQGQPVRAALQIAEGIRHNPNNALLKVQHIIASCSYRYFPQERLEEAKSAIKNQPFEQYTIRQLEVLARYVLEDQCGALTTADILRLLNSALAHTGVQHHEGMLEELRYLQGRLLLTENRVDAAQEAFLRAADVTWNVEAPIQMAAIMASADHYEKALALLDKAEEDLLRAPSGLRERLRQTTVDYESEIERLRQQIRKDMHSHETPQATLSRDMHPISPQNR